MMKMKQRFAVRTYAIKAAVRMGARFEEKNGAVCV